MIQAQEHGLLTNLVTIFPNSRLDGTDLPSAGCWSWHRHDSSTIRHSSADCSGKKRRPNWAHCPCFCAVLGRHGFHERLSDNSREYFDIRAFKKLPGFDASAISTAGATQIQDLVSKEQLPTVLAAYNAGIVNTFYCALAFSCLAFVASFFM